MLLDNVLVNYTVIDVDGNYIAQNKTMMGSISRGLTKAQDVDMPSWKNCLKVMKSKKRVVVEERYKDKIFLSIKQPILDHQQENCLGIVILSIDITEQKRAEALQIAKEEAEKTASFMEIFAGSIAHELKTPLQVCSLCADLMNGCLIAPTEPKEKLPIFKEWLHKIKKTVKDATYVVDNILLKLRSLSKGEIKKSDFIVVDISKTVKEFMAVYPYAEGEEELLTFVADDDFEYCGDPLLIQHCLFNLVKNAYREIKEAEKGAITIKLSTHDLAYNQLILTDTASGMPCEFLEKLFTQFESRQKLGKGTGLGLSFCKLVMEALGGKISCSSVEGEYTTFTLSFPKIAN
jgi:signal transduction histidine kinase